MQNLYRVVHVSNATRVPFQVLATDVHRKWNLQEVKELTGFNDLEVASAIGWLAREDKIQFELEHHDTKDKNALLYLMLNVYF